jgi:arginine/lysine/ornithine decarboxylase
MTQMTLPTYGGATDIHAHVPGHQGGKNFFLSGQRIIDTKLGHMAKMIKINGIE